jgi:WD40 repeat protein
VSTEVGTPKATSNPYVGPQSFRRGDAIYGRDRETADLLDLIIAERVVLLYSPSGAGKSSLIAAGLVRQLEAEGFEVLPTVRLTHEPPPGSSLSGPPRNRYALSTLLSLEEGLPPEHQHRTAELDATTVAEYLASWPDLDGKPGNEVLLFDQFEEVITADPNDHAAKEEFFADIGVALRDRNLWALFAIREDFLAELDPYARFVPTRFANGYRLELLGVDQALDAMILPAADRGADFKRPAAEKLVDDLRRIRVQRSDGVSEELGPTVEPVQLQVACRQLWNRLGAAADTIDLDDVEAVGNVDQALASYYADCVAAAAAESGVSERALRDWFETELVTPQGIRGQVLYGPRQNGTFSERAVKMLTDAHLVRAESRRGATWYELAHDRLIEPVKDDNDRWREEHLSHFERLAAWWDKQQRPDQALLSGKDLVDAEKWVAANTETLSAREHEFLDASRKAADHAERERRATKRTRRWLVIAVIGFIVAAVGFASAATSAVRAGRAQQQAEQLAGEFEVVALAGTARDELESDVDLGLLLARRAAELSGGPSTEATRNALQLAVDQSPVVTVLRGHGPAQSAVYSPDGRFIASYHDDKSIVVWDASSSEVLYPLRTPEGGLLNKRSLIFSPDGSQLAAVAADGRVAIWPARPDAGEPTWINPRQSEPTWQVAFSPEDGRLAWLGSAGLSVIDESGQTVRGFEGTESADVSGVELEWTPDGEQLVVGGTNRIVSVLDSDTGRDQRQIAEHPTGVLAIDVDPSGSMVASASENVVLINDLDTGEELYRLDRGGMTDISFSSDGSRVVAIDQWGTAVVMDPSHRTPMRWVTVTGMTLRSVDLNPVNAARAVVTTATGEPAIWDVAAAHYDSDVAVEPLPNGGVVTGSNDGSVVAWTADLEPRELIPSSEDPVVDVSVTPSGDLVAVARRSSVIDVVATDNGNRAASFSMGDYGAWAVALSPDGRLVAAGGGDGRIVVWEVSSGDEVATLQKHTDSVVSLAFSPDTTYLLSGAQDSTAIAWNLKTSERQVERLNTRPTAVAWNSTGTLVAVAGEDGSVRFWDTATSTPINEDAQNEHAKIVNDIAFDSTGDRLVSASDDRSIIVWDANAGTMDQRIRQGTAPWRIAFDANGSRVFVGDGSGSPHVVFLDDGELLRAAEDQTTRKLTDNECRRFLAGTWCPVG